MRLLLDTHTLLWYAINHPQLSATGQELIVDATNEILLSPASYWELAIKISIGKLTLQQPYDDFIDTCLNNSNCKKDDAIDNSYRDPETADEHRFDRFSQIRIAHAAFTT